MSGCTNPRGAELGAVCVAPAVAPGGGVAAGGRGAAPRPPPAGGAPPPPPVAGGAVAAALAPAGAVVEPPAAAGAGVGFHVLPQPNAGLVNCRYAMPTRTTNTAPAPSQMRRVRLRSRKVLRGAARRERRPARAGCAVRRVDVDNFSLVRT